MTGGWGGSGTGWGGPLPHRIESANGLKTAGAGLRALTEPMDTATPHGELLFHLFGALAQYERALTQERIRAGLAAARPSGPPGRPAKGTRCGAPGGSSGGFGSGRKHGGGVPDLRYSAQYPLRGAEAGELKER